MNIQDLIAVTFNKIMNCAEFYLPWYAVKQYIKRFPDNPIAPPDKQTANQKRQYRVHRIISCISYHQSTDENCYPGKKIIKQMKHCRSDIEIFTISS